MSHLAIIAEAQIHDINIKYNMIQVMLELHDKLLEWYGYLMIHQTIIYITLQGIEQLWEQKNRMHEFQQLQQVALGDDIYG
jgi:hypothetical protein